MVKLYFDGKSSENIQLVKSFWKHCQLSDVNKFFVASVIKIQLF